MGVRGQIRSGGGGAKEPERCGTVGVGKGEVQQRTALTQHPSSHTKRPQAPTTTGTHPCKCCLHAGWGPHGGGGREPKRCGTVGGGTRSRAPAHTMRTHHAATPSTAPIQHPTTRPKRLQPSTATRAHPCTSHGKPRTAHGRTPHKHHTYPPHRSPHPFMHVVHTHTRTQRPKAPDRTGSRRKALRPPTYATTPAPAPQLGRSSHVHQ
jgi:hypothetical protein